MGKLGLAAGWSDARACIVNIVTMLPAGYNAGT